MRSHKEVVVAFECCVFEFTVANAQKDMIRRYNKLT